MSILLARIDDRLIHGQVVVGCCGSLHARRVILCDPEVMADEFQQRLYAAAVPPDIQLDFCDVPGTAEIIAGLGEEECRHLIVVTGSCAAMRDLCESCPSIDRVCLGGLHHRVEAEEVWPGFFLDAEDRNALRALLDRGIEVVVQRIPGEEAIDAAERLRAIDSPT